ncbi:MAG: glycosyltransferase family 4 protein [Kiritimatiellae bacterium]|nr:glycosyltransferase family 4 protein [Kiritimatiellia bacterium]
MTARPRILFLCPQPFFRWRGSPLRVAFDVQALSESGYGVDLVTMPVGEDHPIPGVRHVRARNIIGAKELPIGPSPQKAVLDLALAAAAARLVKQNRYVAVHGVEDAGAIAAFLGRKHGIPVVFEKHSDPASYKKGIVRAAVLAAYRAVERRSIRAASLVLATGPALAEQAKAVARPGTIVRAVHDIPSSLAEATAEGARAAREALALPDGAVLALYVGSFAVYQGIDLLVDALGKALARVPDLHAAIVGGNAEEIAARKRQLEAADPAIASRVRFLGMRAPDTLPDLFAAADILLSPRTQGTNTPLKLLDYAKAARAVVACDIPANRLILSEENALLAPPSAEGFAAALARVAEDAALRQRLGEAAGRLYRETYNYAHFRGLLAGAYSDMLSGETAE